ncbi:hypothetical protein QQP08_009618, partial [Theobroma cacao]
MSTSTLTAKSTFISTLIASKVFLESGCLTHATSTLAVSLNSIINWRAQPLQCLQLQLQNRRVLVSVIVIIYEDIK